MSQFKCLVCGIDTVASWLCRHQISYCSTHLKSLPKEAKDENQPFKSSTCECVYCCKACRDESKCRRCGVCACRTDSCLFDEEKTFLGRGHVAQAKEPQSLCSSCHLVLHGTCFHCKKQTPRFHSSSLIECYKQCQVCKKPTCGKCSTKANGHLSTLCQSCAMTQSRSFHCSDCDSITDRLHPIDRCTICDRSICKTSKPGCTIPDCQNSEEIQEDDENPDPKVLLCCLHQKVSESCSNCSATGMCGTHRIPCETCGQTAICFQCASDKKSFWDSHWTTEDKKTGKFAPLIPIQCKSCQVTTRAIFGESGLIPDLQRMLYRTLFGEWN